MRLFCRVSVLVTIFATVSLSSFAQDDIDELLQESVADGRKLVNAYVAPVMKSLSLGLNQGWYNTAKPHKIAGVDLTITVNAMTIPDADLLFEPNKLGLTKVSLSPSSSGYPYASTIVGPDRTPTFQVTDPDGTVRTFQGPAGLDLKGETGYNKVPVPMVHLGFGLPKGTDIKFRYIPTLDVDDNGSVKMFGVGVMHDIKQWIPGIKLMPFDLSVFAGFTKFELQSLLDATDNPDQRGIFTMNATTVQAVIGKKFSVITFYGGIGYNIAKSNLALKGGYDINGDGDETDQFEKDPVDLKFAASGPRATIGTRLKLAVFTFHADYTLQKYKCLTVGFGISVR